MRISDWSSDVCSFRSLLRSLSRSPEVPQILAYGLGLGLLAIALEAVWRRPAAPPPSAESQLRGLGRRGAHWLLTIYFAALWLLWVASAMPLFWTVVFVFALPAAARLTPPAGQPTLPPAGPDGTVGHPPAAYLP